MCPETDLVLAYFNITIYDSVLLSNVKMCGKDKWCRFLQGNAKKIVSFKCMVIYPVDWNQVYM